MEIQTATAAERRIGESKMSAIAAATRSNAYLTANCQPTGLVGRAVDEGEPAEMLDFDPLGDLLEQARDDGDADTHALAAVDDLEQFLVRRLRERHDSHA